MKTLLIDDEPRSRANLRNLIEDYCISIEIADEASNAKDAIAAIKKHQPDFIFLDVQMPEMNGLELANALQAKSEIPIVFVTAFENYAVKAIRLKAFDYLLKPIKISELQDCMNRLKQHLETKSNSELNKQGNRIKLPWQNGFKLVNKEDIVVIESDNAYSIFHFKNDESLVFSKSIGDLEKMLDSNSFFRIHNSYIINLSHLEEFSTRDGGMVQMANSKQYPVSRRRLAEFKQISKSRF